MRLQRLLVTAATLTLLVGSFSTASAQDTKFRNLFNVSTPGARANAMGRAFIGVADDATAAATNPAGLVLMSRPQVYLEVKTKDTIEEDFLISPAAVSFLAASIPLTEKVSVAFSRQEFFRGEVPGDEFFDGYTAQGTSYQGSIAARVSPKLLVGATVAKHLTSDSDGFEDSTFGAVLGALFLPNEKVSIGGSGSFAANSEVIPSRAGFGVGLRPVPRVLVSVDVTWTGYSSLGLETSDATEVHLGGEYSLLTTGSNRVFARAGFFSASASEEFGESRQSVGTFGVGAAMGARLQVDFAVLTSGTALVSAGLRF